MGSGEPEATLGGALLSLHLEQGLVLDCPARGQMATVAAVTDRPLCSRHLTLGGSSSLPVTPGVRVLMLGVQR